MTKKSKWLQILSGGIILILIGSFAVLYANFSLFRLPWVSGVCFLTIAFLILGVSILLRRKVDKNTSLYFRIIYWGLIFAFLIGIIRALTGI